MRWPDDWLAGCRPADCPADCQAVPRCFKYPWMYGSNKYEVEVSGFSLFWDAVWWPPPKEKTTKNSNMLKQISKSQHRSNTHLSHVYWHAFTCWQMMSRGWRLVFNNIWALLSLVGCMVPLMRVTLMLTTPSGIIVTVAPTVRHIRESVTLKTPWFGTRSRTREYWSFS